MNYIKSEYYIKRKSQKHNVIHTLNKNLNKIYLKNGRQR